MSDWAQQIKEQAAKAVPPVEGTLKVEGLEGPVEVFRDEWGVPHIYARSLHDVLFAQGFVVASERLFQLDFMLRLANGRLSELVSEMALPDFDFFLKNEETGSLVVGTKDGAFLAFRSGPAPVRPMIMGSVPAQPPVPPQPAEPPAQPAEPPSTEQPTGR